MDKSLLEDLKLHNRIRFKGVVSLVIDGGGGRNGLTFWVPNADEDDNAYDIISYQSHEKHDEFNEKSYQPTKSIGLRIDCIVP